MTPIIDTKLFRHHILAAFAQKALNPEKDTYAPGDGVELIPADDRELLAEQAINPVYTVKHWLGWIYQKQEDGKWKKLARSPEKSKSEKK